MYCQHCGSPLTDEDLFCSVCGKPVVRKAPPAQSAPAAGRPASPLSPPAQPVIPPASGQAPPSPPAPPGKRRRRIPTALLCLLFLLAGAAGGYFLLGGGGEQSPLPVEQYWDDPDQLAMDCVAALEKGDVEAILAMSDISQQLQYYQWTGNVQYTGAVGRNFLFLSDSPAVRQAAEDKLRCDLTAALPVMWTSVFAGKSPVAEVMGSAMMRPASEFTEEELRDYLSMMGEESLSRIRYTPFLVSLDAEFAARVVESAGVRYSGAVTDYREYLVLLSCDGGYGLTGITLYQYGGGWKLHSFSAAVGGVSSLGGECLTDLEGASQAEAEQYLLDRNKTLIPLAG